MHHAVVFYRYEALPHSILQSQSKEKKILAIDSKRQINVFRYVADSGFPACTLNTQTLPHFDKSFSPWLN